MKNRILSKISLMCYLIVIGSALSVLVNADSVGGIVHQGESLEYMMQGKQYTVSVLMVGGESEAAAVADLLVNDERSPPNLKKGDTFTVKDGTRFRITGIFFNGQAVSNENSVAFSIEPAGVETIRATLDRDQIATYNLNGKDYTVQVNFAVNDAGSEAFAYLFVNGEDSPALRKGESHTFANGATIWIGNILTLDPLSESDIRPHIAVDFELTTSLESPDKEPEEEIVPGLNGEEVRAAVKLGEHGKYSLEGHIYDVSLMIVSGEDPQTAIVKMIINGEVTAPLKKGQSYTLSRGEKLSIRNVFPNLKPGEGDGISLYNAVDFELSIADVDWSEEESDEGTLNTACSAEFAPVCGVDGSTYPSKCFAEKIAKVKISHTGECTDADSNQGSPIDKLTNLPVIPDQPSWCDGMRPWFEGESREVTGQLQLPGPVIQGVYELSVSSFSDSAITVSVKDKSGTETKELPQGVRKGLSGLDLQFTGFDGFGNAWICVKETAEAKLATTCDGCVRGDRCIPVGTRLSNGKKEYCDLSTGMTEQRGSDASCQNNYECSTNLCIDSHCVNENFLRKVIRWFQSIFSRGD